MDKYTIKLTHQSETRHITLKSSEQPFTDLVEVVRARFASLSEQPRSTISLTYIDSDGDEITLSTDDELKELLSSADGTAFKFTLHAAGTGSHTQTPVNDYQGLSGKLQHEIRSTTPVSHDATPPAAAASQPFDDPPETPAEPASASSPRQLPHLNDFINSLPQRTQSVREAVAASVNDRSTQNADFSALNDLPDVLRNIMNDLGQALGQVKGDVAREVEKAKAEFANIQQELKEQRERTRAAYRRGHHPHPHHHANAHSRPFGDPRVAPPQPPHAPPFSRPFHPFFPHGHPLAHHSSPTGHSTGPKDSTSVSGYDLGGSDQFGTAKMPGSFDVEQASSTAPDLAALYRKLELYGLNADEPRLRSIALRVYVENRGADLTVLVTEVLDRLHGDARQ